MFKKYSDIKNICAICHYIGTITNTHLNKHKISLQKYDLYFPKQQAKIMSLCICKCGGYTKLGRKFIQGHNLRTSETIAKQRSKLIGRKQPLEQVEKMRQTKVGKPLSETHKTNLKIARNARELKKQIKEIKLCGCNWCGLYTKPGNKFINGHNSWGRPATEKQREASRKVGALSKGRKITEKTRKKLIVASNNIERTEKLILRNIANKGVKRSNVTIEKMKVSQNTLGQIEKLKSQAIRQCADPNSNFGKGWSAHRKESYSEKYFREFLEFMGAVKDVDFFQEYHVGRYSLDFVFIDGPGQMRCIETDGGQHDTPEAIEHDRARDKYLLGLGIVVMRIKARNLKKFLSPLWPVT